VNDCLDYLAEETILGGPKMKAHTFSMVCLAGLLFMNVLLGCKENPVGPEQQATYETAVFGTFRGIWADHTLDGITGSALSLDSTSYIRIEKSDRSYSIRLHGTDKSTGTVDFSFEERGHIQIEDITYTPGGDWKLGYWEGRIVFTPDSAVNYSLWLVEFWVDDYPSVRDILKVHGNCLIYLGQGRGYLTLHGWRTRYPY
jgi:hypothetical protein